jgi:hypothetical protein
MSAPPCLELHPRFAARLARHIAEWPEQELAVLLGTRGRAGRPAVARSMLAVRRARRDAPPLAVDESALAQAHRLIARHDTREGNEIVGWYAARPGQGIEPTTGDAHAHARLFPAADHRMLLFDPAADRVAVYATHPGGGLAFRHGGPLMSLRPARRRSARTGTGTVPALAAAAGGAGLGLLLWLTTGAGAGPFGLVVPHL